MSDEGGARLSGASLSDKKNEKGARKMLKGRVKREIKNRQWNEWLFTLAWKEAFGTLENLERSLFGTEFFEGKTVEDAKKDHDDVWIARSDFRQTKFGTIRTLADGNCVNVESIFVHYWNDVEYESIDESLNQMRTILGEGRTEALLRAYGEQICGWMSATTFARLADDVRNRKISFLPGETIFGEIMDWREKGYEYKEYGWATMAARHKDGPWSLWTGCRAEGGVIVRWRQEID